MSAADASQAFTARFKEALLTRGYGRLGPTELVDALAVHFEDGLSVQTVHKWLNGTAIPRQDRIDVLAGWLNVSPHWLKFGPDPSADLGKTSDRPIATKDLVKRIQRLPKTQRDIIETLLKEFERTSLD